MLFREKVKRWSAWLNITVAVISTGVLAGWLLNASWFISLAGNMRSPSPFGAVLCLLLAASLRLLSQGSTVKSRIGQSIAILVAIAALGKLLAGIDAWPFKIDEFLFAGLSTAEAARATMPPAVAFGFLLVSISLLLHQRSWPMGKKVANFLLLLTGFLAWFSVQGFTFRAPELLSENSLFAMSAYTSVSFVCIALAILLAHPDNSFMRELMQPLGGSRFGRMALPSVVLVPFLLGYVRLWGHWNNLLSTEFGVSILTCSIMVVFLALVWNHIVVLNNHDKVKHKNDDALLELNNHLQLRNNDVAALNEELRASNEELQAGNEELKSMNDQLQQAADKIKEQSALLGKQKDERLNRALESSNVLVWSLDLTNQGDHYFSRTLEPFLDDRVSAVSPGIRWLERLVHPDDVPTYQQAAAALEKTDSVEATYRIVDRAGAQRWVRTHQHLIRNEWRQPVRLEGVASELTALKNAEQALAQERNLLRTIIDNIPDYIFVKDLTHRHIMNNAANVALLGYASEEETLGRTTADYFGEQGERYMDDDRYIFQTGQSIVNKEEIITDSAQRERILLTTKVPLYKGADIHGVIGISRDITESRRQEIATRQSEANLRTIFDHTIDAFTLLDAGYRVVDFNVVSAEISNHRLKKGENILNTVDPARRDIFHRYLLRAEAGEMVHYETSYPAAGETAWYGITIVAVRSAQTLVGYCITTHNLTSAKHIEAMRAQREKEIRASEKQLQDFQNAIYKASIVSRADRAGKITLVNENFVRISGYSKHELLGQDHRMINSGYHSREFWSTMWKTIAAGQTWRREVKNRAKDGSEYWVDTFITPFLDEQGNVREFLSIRNDITHRKNVEEALEQSKYLLDKACEAAGVGYWKFDPHTQQTVWSDIAVKILGLPQPASIEDLLSVVHPDDMASVKTCLLSTVRENQEHAIDHRMVLRDGSIRWIHTETKIIRDVQRNVVFLMGVVQDISHRKVTEEVLKEFNERYEILSRATNDAIWDWDLSLGIVTWNHGLQSIFGYSDGEMNFTTHWWKERLHPDDRARVMAGLESTFAARQHHWTATYRYQCADGSFKHVHDRAYVLYQRNTAVRVIGAMQDITEQIEATKEIRKLSLVASQARNAVMITDAHNRIEWVNESFERLTGYALAEIMGRPSGDFLHGAETNPATVKYIHEKLSRTEPVSAELINYTREGKKYWVSLSTSPVFDDDKNLKHFISIQSDVSEQKEYEANLTAIARELANLIEHANVPIFGADLLGNINEWNSVSTRLTGYSKADLYTKNWVDELVDAESKRTARQAVKKVLKGEAVSNLELPIVTRSRKRLTLLLSASPRRNTENKIDGIIVVAQDISELIAYRKGLEKMVDDRTRELSEALKKEKEVVEMKTKFVSIASHEFRTPLASIHMAASFIRKFHDRIDTPDVDRKLENIERQVHHMTAMLDDVLMIGKSEAGKIHVRRSEINISEFFRSLVRELKPVSENKIGLKIHCTQNLISTDEKLMRNIVVNLLTNALKFSPDKTPVSLRVSGDSEMLEIQVADQGVGIPAADLKNLFTPFYRGANVHVIPGTGLGLSIVRKAVELLQGHVAVSSAEGTGSTFTVTLPLQK